MLGLLELDTEAKLDQGTDNPEDCAHIVDQRDPDNDITTAIVFGWNVTALCGYSWIPYRDPMGKPVCEECCRIYAEII